VPQQLAVVVAVHIRASMAPPVARVVVLATQIPMAVRPIREIATALLDMEMQAQITLVVETKRQVVAARPPLVVLLLVNHTVVLVVLVSNGMQPTGIIMLLAEVVAHGQITPATVVMAVEAVAELATTALSVLVVETHEIPAVLDR
jgi:hypothetical protein